MAIPIVMLTADTQVDRRILQEADTLRAAGFDVTIVAMPAGEHDQGENDAANNIIRVDLSHVNGPVSQGYWVHRINRTLKKILNTDRFLYRTIRLTVLRLMPDPTPFYVRAFMQVLETLPARIYVAHDLPMLPVAKAAIAINPAAIVYDSHELFCEQGFTRAEKRRWQRMERATIGSASHIITVNPSIARQLKEIYGLENVSVLRNAVPKPAAFPMPSRYFHQHFTLAPFKKIVLYQGGFVPGRNLDQLILAWNYLRDSDWDLVMMGNGPERNLFEALVYENNLAEKVHMHPAVAQDALLEYTAAADLGVIPYQATCLNNYYCTPNKLFEFVMAGLPILAQDLPEIAAIVTEYDIGRIDDLKNAASLARAITSIANDPQQLEHYAENARKCRLSLNWEEESRFLPAVMTELVA